jgi:hypothetical protein
VCKMWSFLSFCQSLWEVSTAAVSAGIV